MSPVDVTLTLSTYRPLRYPCREMPNSCRFGTASSCTTSLLGRELDRPHARDHPIPGRHDTTAEASMPVSASPNYRHRLPQLDGRLFLTDGGLETTLIFHEGWDLPIFQAFTLLESERGRAALRAYFDRYLPLAVRQGMGFVLESPTWRASRHWRTSTAPLSISCAKFVRSTRRSAHRSLSAGALVRVAMATILVRS